MIAIKPEEYKKLKDYHFKTNVPIWRIIKDYLKMPEDVHIQNQKGGQE